MSYAEDVDPYVDKIGGRPVWFKDSALPPAAWASCGACDKPLLLILQMWAKLPELDKDSRVYYLLACNTRRCMSRPGSWRIIKAIHRSAPVTTTPRKKSKAQKPNEKQADATISSPVAGSPRARSEGTPKKQKGQKVQEKQAAPPTPSTPTTKLAWDAPSTPSFGNSGIPFFPTPSSPLFGEATVGSPNCSLAELLAARDKKYAWGDADEDDTAVPTDLTESNASAENAREPSCSSEGLTEDLSAKQTSATDCLASTLSKSLHLKAPTPAEAVPCDAWSAAPTFPAYPLEFAPESTESESYEHELRLLAEYKRTEKDDLEEAMDADGTSALGWSGEGYEKTRPKYLNKAFKRFQKIVEEDPEQCVRYAFHGQPQFYNNDDVSARLTEVGAPTCERCRGPRAFEFQLMPMILSLLPTEQLVPRAEKGTAGAGKKSKKSRKAAAAAAAAAATAVGKGEDGENEERGSAPTTSSSSSAQPSLSAFLDRFACGMDWGTVLVYVCAADCETDPVAGSSGTVSYSEEYVAVQVESLM
ncbi:hypothetical protein HKX48_007615 [Thoreauomyces humboldtii]|nr:hypothetical protein HKX48_007615 [Thoreauomyces humboldtii]